MLLRCIPRVLNRLACVLDLKTLGKCDERREMVPNLPGICDHPENTYWRRDRSPCQLRSSWIEFKTCVYEKQPRVDQTEPKQMECSSGWISQNQGCTHCQSMNAAPLTILDWRAHGHTGACSSNVPDPWLHPQTPDTRVLGTRCSSDCGTRQKLEQIDYHLTTEGGSRLLVLSYSPIGQCW